MSPNDVECKVRHHPLSGTPTRRVSTRAPRLMQETMESQTHAPAWIGASPAMPGNYRLQVTGYSHQFGRETGVLVASNHQSLIGPDAAATPSVQYLIGNV